MRIQKRKPNKLIGVGVCFSIKEHGIETVLCRLLGSSDGRYGVHSQSKCQSWLSSLSDYHQFARENSDELAGAIESGIPGSLRGMMWQLM